jgi:hypothetical protein
LAAAPRAIADQIVVGNAQPCGGAITCASGNVGFSLAGILNDTISFSLGGTPFQALVTNDTGGVVSSLELDLSGTIGHSSPPEKFNCDVSGTAIFDKNTAH